MPRKGSERTTSNLLERFLNAPGTPRAECRAVTFGPLSSSLDSHFERHSLPASTIAHVDTPRYKPNDPARLYDTPYQKRLHTTPDRTHPGHLSMGSSRPSVEHVLRHLSAGGGANGNFADPQGYLECPHVSVVQEVVEEIVNMLTGSRAYEANVIKATQGMADSALHPGRT